MKITNKISYKWFTLVVFSLVISIKNIVKNIKSILVCFIFGYLPNIKIIRREYGKVF